MCMCVCIVGADHHWHRIGIGIILLRGQCGEEKGHASENRDTATHSHLSRKQQHHCTGMDARVYKHDNGPVWHQ